MVTLRDWTYARPEKVTSLEECSFYHWMDLPSAAGDITVRGSWDLRGRFRDYLGGVDVAGKSVLDVGTASGWISFEAEKHGAAEVVGLEVADDVRPQYVPYFQNGDRERLQGPSTTDAGPVRPSMRSSYWFAHSRYKSAAKLVYGDVYKLSDHMSGADIVVVGQILVHQRDPLEALLQCARVADDTLIIVEGSFEASEPLVKFVGVSGIHYSWFLLSSRMYVEYLKILGFEIQSITRNDYRCTHRDATPEMEIWTFVAKRVGPTLGRKP